MESLVGFRSFRRVESRRTLAWATAVTGLTFLAEAVGGLLTNSLALLSDAGHMFTHLLALVVALLAAVLSQSPPTERRTYGLKRIEILAALFNGTTLLLITVAIFYEAYRRLREPEPVATGAMLAIAVVGLAVNLIAAFILRDSHQHDLNVRGVFMHLLADTFSSLAVIAGGVVMALTGWTLIDPVLSVIICLAILFWAYRLILDAVDILLEATPRGVNLQEVVEGLKRIPGIRDVHHLHVWAITSGMYALSAHLDVDDLRVSETEELALEAERFLKERLRISHATFQFEHRRVRTGETLTQVEISAGRERQVPR
jgi:cobalt-zinc-cadmium efflux system protein